MTKNSQFDPLQEAVYKVETKVSHNAPASFKWFSIWDSDNFSLSHKR